MLCLYNLPRTLGFFYFFVFFLRNLTNLKLFPNIFRLFLFSGSAFHCYINLTGNAGKKKID